MDSKGAIPWQGMISILHRLGPIFELWIGPTLGSQSRPSTIGPQLIGSSALVWYVRCLDSLKRTLWVWFHGWYWYQSFIDGSNIWGVDRTDPWGLKIDHPLFGRSYLVVVPSYDISSALIILTGLYGWDSMTGIDINPSSNGPIFGVWVGPPLGFRNGPSAIGPQLFGSSAVVWYVRFLDYLNLTPWVRFHGWYWYQSFIDGSNIWGVARTDPWGPEMDHPPLGRSYLVVVPSYAMSGSLILLTRFYGWDSMAGIDINPSLMGPIFGVWIRPTLGFPKWTIRHWAAAIW